jgi:thioredoxin 1
MKKNKIFTIFYFTADWCGPCKMFKHVLEKFIENNSEQIIFNKINVDQNRETALEYGINSIPTLLFFKNNKLIQKKTGIASLNDLEKIISM